MVPSGGARAAFDLGGHYTCCDQPDTEKALEYLQKSASLGYVPAYFMIYALQFDKGNIEEGILNLRKAVICGISRDEFFTSLRDGYREGYITKEEYAYTLRENQASCDNMKSDNGRKRRRFLICSTY